MFAKNLNIQIYNNWGNIIYSSDKIDFEWNGENMNTGQNCPQGSYVFKYELIGHDGTRIKNEGTVIILR